MDEAAVTQAIAEAVTASTATPGAVALSALTSSNLPPRRSGGSRALLPIAPQHPAAAADTGGGPSEAQQAERRRLDEQLQSRAEARIRARAQGPMPLPKRRPAPAPGRPAPAPESPPRNAPQPPAGRPTSRRKWMTSPRSRRPCGQGGQPPHPSRRLRRSGAALIWDGRRSSGSSGPARASRALIRLRNGKIVTVRLGDRIDGGTIISIGGGKITYVKNGRQQELRMLDGR
ncbi:hypothetical protein PE067_05055 [Paracoccus sp. DMF-8]|uniref:hypothetical protein n=1 Tax=Paracoccus sp. DMF-8 TaxID=3019445 RepID=UPI0023E7A3FD|nr:hypothetical protein [Paracoccus sp. DMF-8]MDF3605569.1 hypothetical protein [Paracoccus sp. DMF-8]